MAYTKTFKLYRVTFATAVRFANGETYNAGDTRDILASSLQSAGSQSTTCDTSDIAEVELVTVNPTPVKTARIDIGGKVTSVPVPQNGKDARKIARLSGANTRHMLAFPARVLATAVLNQRNTTARLTTARDSVVTFRIGGAY